MNDITGLVVTKLDVLSGLPAVKICVAYRAIGKDYPDLPMGVADLSPFEPVYEEMPGWEESLNDARKWNQLPKAARQYISRLSDLAGAPVHSISVGPERDQAVNV